MLIRPTEQEVADYWYLHVKGWEINLKKNSGTFYRSETSRAQVVCACQNIVCKVKDKLFLGPL